MRPCCRSSSAVFASTISRYVDEIGNLPSQPRRSRIWRRCAAKLPACRRPRPISNGAYCARCSESRLGLAGKASRRSTTSCFTPSAPSRIDPGLPGRPWYRHRIYAPGMYTGYEAKTLPGIREAVEAGNTG